MNDSPLSPEGFAAAAGVSRETLGRLQRYVDLLAAWNARINLVARGTLADAWRRHVLDSAQLLPLIPAGTRILLDIGSGAGFPGLVLAIIGVPGVHLVEADARKCAFLREAARVTGTSVTIHNKRAESLPSMTPDIVTARAVADLGKLLDTVERFLAPHTICLFPKGETAAEELTRARKEWKMQAALVPSVTDPAGAILRLEQLARVIPRERD